MSFTGASAGRAEVNCSVQRFKINTYIYGMPSLEAIELTGGGTMANVSLCGTNCTGAATDQRLSVALTAQSRGAPLVLYFGDKSTCSAVTAYEKPYGITLQP